ncbi:Uncharacterised protein [Mycobacteroides abscessus subsp. abscessus]|nr:Uncharacterised protein [Mycobacteroides abscessus subsp. abscessus]
MIAAESVHPVPCVFGVAIRGWANSVTSPSAVTRMSATSPSAACPPLRRTARVPRATSSLAWSRICSGVVASGTSSPRRRAASGRFGVMRSAAGSRRVRTASTASTSRRRCPEVATMTGSTVKNPKSEVAARSTTRSTSDRDPSMPVFVASTGMSFSTLSSSSVTKSSSIG